ncbi:hypothetical protein DNTS_010139, partial [Danionella cerebrum]
MLVSGLYSPFTLPVGEEVWGPQSPSTITDSFSDCEPMKRHPFPFSSVCNSSPSLDCSTPLSMDTAYSSMHQDTPSSFWPTPQYQETPCTPSLTHSRPDTPSQCEGTSIESAVVSTLIHKSIPSISKFQEDVTQPTAIKPNSIHHAVQNF